jgi:hypothetical protein
VPPDEPGEGEHARERSELGRPVVADQRRDRDERGEADEHGAEAAMEASGLEPRPLVEEADDLASVVGVGAGVLARAGVADLRFAAVAEQPALVVVLVQPQVLALGAFPRVEVLVVAEARGAVALAAAVRVAREQVEAGGKPEQEERVARREYDFGVERAQAWASGASTGSVISVKRISSGSSSVTCLTVWRTPSQQR